MTENVMMNTCDRCKHESPDLKPLTLQGETKGTTFNLCGVCMAAARTFWGHFMSGESLERTKNKSPTTKLDEEGDMTDDSLMYFGQYKGEKMKNIPAKYLLWIADQEWASKWPRVLKYINKNRNVLEEEAEEEKDDE